MDLACNFGHKQQQSSQPGGVRADSCLSNIVCSRGSSHRVTDALARNSRFSTVFVLEYVRGVGTAAARFV